MAISHLHRRARRHRPIVAVGCPPDRPPGRWRPARGGPSLAGALLAKTTLLRTVLADLHFTRATDGRLFWLQEGERAVHPDWMAAVRTPLPASLRLEQGDF